MKKLLLFTALTVLSCSEKEVKPTKDDLQIKVSYNYLMSVYRLGYAKGGNAQARAYLDMRLSKNTEDFMRKFDKYESIDTLDYGKEIRLILSQQRK